MIKFNCEKCGQKLSVPETHSGKKGKCPRCKNIIVVPATQNIDSILEKTDIGSADLAIKDSADNEILQDTVEKDKIQNDLFGFSKGPEKDTEHEQEPEEEPFDYIEGPPERKHPWYIDIFLYPICLPCLVTIAIVVIIPLLINLTIGLLGPFGILALPFGMFINLVISMYFLWYLAECIRDSAEGGIRAPETMANAPSLGELFGHLLRLLICIFIFAGPVGYYFIKTDRIDAIFWALLAFAVFFLPIGLLSVTMFDSIRGLNPLLLIASVISTHFIYLGLVIILLGIAFSVIFLLRTLNNKWLIFLSGYFEMYILFIVAHLLGRFYWQYQEKLNWDV
jgi:phage FluMu protein Com